MAISFANASTSKDNVSEETVLGDLGDQILEMIKTQPGQKAKDIATRLGLDRRVVNSALFGQLKGKVQQDRAYRWYLSGTRHTGDRSDSETERLDTPLARLCRYYLECLSHDDLDGVSEFATSIYGQPNYVEVYALPISDADATDPFESEGARQLLARARRDRNRKAIVLGYPVRLTLLRSRRSKWEGFKVEPLLLFPFQEVETRHGRPLISDDLPQINFRALRSLSNADQESFMEEAIQLAEELGLTNAPTDQPDLDEMFSRLREIRPEWDWQENPIPYALSRGTPLADLKQQGIYNRAILVCVERSQYTKGLESELGRLQSIEESKYRNTALGSWLTSECIDSPPAGQEPLLEVLPLNSEQRQAVRQALTNPLTVITGPPGTGKSQVVTSILINAVWQGKPVLFASKNNKAVDVVETRVNVLGPRPVLLRLGRNEFQGRLAEYLVSLLAATATAEDHERYRECVALHSELQERSDALDAKLHAFVRLRNEVDALEQHVEKVRQTVGPDVFRKMRRVDAVKFAAVAARLGAAIDSANKQKHNLRIKIAWPLLRKARFRRVLDEAEPFRRISGQLGLPFPEGVVSSSTINQYVEYGCRLAALVSYVTQARQYFDKLEALAKAVSLEELSRRRKVLTDELAAKSEALWRAWLRLQPARMTPQQRKLLGDYSALLQLIVSANERSQQLGRDVYRRYYQLFPQISSILSCWAVTALSARGRLPFEPNFFDLLVVDEASQCDIASALPLLFRARRIVVIGDPMQLRHISTLSKRQDQQLLSKHELIDDRPGWAYSIQSLFDLASSLCRSEDIVALRDHHRSHAEIIQFSNETFYEGRLRVATNYDRLRRPRQEPVVRWVEAPGKTIRPGSGGAVNEEEARKVVSELERLLRQGYRGSVGVVSPFRAQANRIRDLVYQSDGLSSRIAEIEFLADTVHKFQGDERDVMIFSPVVSRGVTESALGFLRRNPNLFNVAITRARAALIVVGDRSAAMNCGVDYLSRFASYVGQLGCTPQPSGGSTVNECGPEYPRVAHPERVSDWERVFYRAVYAAGIRAIPQYEVEKYALDFAVIAGARRLNIEIDGERYHRNWDGELCRRDQIRNQRLMELGWDIMRFWVYQIRDDLAWCVSSVRRWTDAEPTGLGCASGLRECESPQPRGD